MLLLFRGVDVFGLRLHLLISRFQLLPQPGFGWGSEKRHNCRGANNNVKVNPRPNLNGRLQAEEHERGCGEAEGQLGGEVGDEVVIRFISRRALTVRCEEERSDISAEIFSGQRHGLL